MSEVSLLFFRGSGWAAAWVRWWTKSHFAHVAPCITNAEGSFVYHAYWASGVTRRLVADGETPAARVVLSGLEARDWQTWLDAQVGKPYDKVSIVLIGLTKRSPKWLHVYVSRQGEWICSRLSAAVAGLETRCWGLTGPPSPEDVFEMLSAKIPLTKKEDV